MTSLRNWFWPEADGVFFRPRLNPLLGEMQDLRLLEEVHLAGCRR